MKDFSYEKTTKNKNDNRNMNKTCKTCEYFERNRWHKSIDPEESYQLGGYCEVLNKVFRITNAFMWNERIHIQESFGCVFYKNKENK